jgi:transposase-like protein
MGFMDIEGMVPAVTREVEVLAKAERRRFTLEYKRRILQEAEACKRPGELGALLRREGLYSSHLAAWRQARVRNELAGTSAKKRGPKPRSEHPDLKKYLALERELRQMRRRAERAEALVELQKKVAALLGNELPPSGEES